MQDLESKIYSFYSFYVTVLLLKWNQPWIWIVLKWASRYYIMNIQFDRFKSINTTFKVWFLALNRGTLNVETFTNINFCIISLEINLKTSL